MEEKLHHKARHCESICLRKVTHRQVCFVLHLELLVKLKLTDLRFVTCVSLEISFKSTFALVAAKLEPTTASTALLGVHCRLTTMLETVENGLLVTTCTSVSSRKDVRRQTARSITVKVYRGKWNLRYHSVRFLAFRVVRASCPRRRPLRLQMIQVSQLGTAFVSFGYRKTGSLIITDSLSLLGKGCHPLLPLSWTLSLKDVPLGLAAVEKLEGILWQLNWTAGSVAISGGSI